MTNATSSARLSLGQKNNDRRGHGLAAGHKGFSNVTAVVAMNG